MCWYCIRLDIYSILVLAYCFANKPFTEHHRTLSKWWATEETPTMEALDCSFPCFLCYTLVCKPWRFHFLHGWSLIYGIFFVNTPQNKKYFVRSAFCFGTMCSAPAERDVPFGRDVCFANDVRFARVAEHITSLCAKGAIHHYGEAITSLRLAATSLLLTPHPFSAIMKPTIWKGVDHYVCNCTFYKQTTTKTKYW